MSIRIEQVNVKNLGPLNDFPCTLKQVNLFYGLNEQGKTYLVEFIYKCLFKNKALGLRDISASGQVMVSGLENGGTTFSPTKGKKLEDFWDESLPGLPRDFSKLLVVKGADLDLSSGNSAGIDDKILKEFLSGEGLLEKISSKIRTTESSASYENGKISGGKRGMVQDYNKSQDFIQHIDDTFLDLNRNISGGERFELTQKIEMLRKKKDDQEQARRHLAFNLAGQVSELREQLDRIPAELITTVDKNIETHHQTQTALENTQQDLEKKRESSKDYPWLEAAVTNYQNLILAGNSFKPRSGMILAVSSLIATALAVFLVLIRQPYFGVGMILLAVLFGLLYLRGLIKSKTNIAQQEEIEKIAKGYQERFGEGKVVQEATLVAKQKELQPVYFAIEQLTSNIQTLTGELKDKGQQINLDLKRLPGTKAKMGDWQAIIDALREKRKGLEDEFHTKDKELSSLNVAESDFLQEPVVEPYNPQLLKTFSADLEKSEKELREADEKLQGLKQAACGITDEDISIPWEDLVEALNHKRQEEVIRYRNITATILSQIIVNQVLEDLRQIEEERIEEGLAFSIISQALLTTTSHYDRVEKEGGELYVADSYGRYRVKDLSTGAHEQVLLGLRIGFAAKILSGTPLFLILDDAFQHSDWKRREGLVKKLFDLSKEGWQIIYFTMDDHIRTLFESNAKKVGKSQYQTITLQSG